MNIAGYEINLGGFNLMSIASMLLWGVGIFIVLGIIGYFVWSWWNKKTAYTNPCTLTTYFDNGTKKTVYGMMGGKFTNKHGVIDFRVKPPKGFKKKELGYVPDLSKADADGTLHFMTTHDGNFWQQTEHILQTRESVEEVITENGKETKRTVYYDLIVKPVRADVKAYTMNAQKSWRELLDKNKITVYAIAIAAFIIMVIAHLISLYIQTKIKCGA